MTVTGDALPWRTALRQLLAVGAELISFSSSSQASLVFASAGALLVCAAALAPPAGGLGREEKA
ncbi:Protein of unknown function [Gryllus bimaculatus]|nr:Protein of unknown function [Gryllus bimaculatus]